MRIFKVFIEYVKRFVKKDKKSCCSSPILEQSKEKKIDSKETA